MTYPASNFGDHREASDHYYREVYREGVWRVIVCRDAIQWILQRQTRKGSPDGARWEAVSYCATRDALMRLWRASTGQDYAPFATLLLEHFARNPDA